MLNQSQEITVFGDLLSPNELPPPKWCSRILILHDTRFVLFMILLKNILYNPCKIWPPTYQTGPYRVYLGSDRKSLSCTQPWNYERLLKEYGWRSLPVTSSNMLRSCRIDLLSFTEFEEASHNIKDLFDDF